MILIEMTVPFKLLTLYVIYKLDFTNLGILNFSSIKTPWDMEQIPWNHDIGFWYLHLIVRFYVSLLL